MPLGAMALTAILLSGAFVYFWKPDKNHDHKPQAPVDERIASIHKLLARGNLRQARHNLDQLVADKELVNFTSEREVRQLARETGIVCDLLAESLEDIMQAAANMEAKAWELEFRERYQGRAVLFDAHFQRDARDHWKIDYQVYRGRDAVRLDFDRVELLQALGRLPLPSNQRLLLGVRLEEIKLELPGPAWVIHFDKASGVLLTHRDVTRQLGPDLALDNLLEVQAEWVRKAR